MAGLRRRRICVNPHRKPEKNAAEMMRTNPRGLKSTSPATIMMTPTVIVAIIATSFQEGTSSRKRNAKRRTKARAEDLHIAVELKVSILLTCRGRLSPWQ